MPRIVRSIKGELVDFDQFKIKGQLIKTPKNETTKARERFIDKKRRRTTRTVDQMLAQQEQHHAAVNEALAKSKLAKADDSMPVQAIVEAEQKAAVVPPPIFKK